MASIVEKETAVAEERPLVASVYYNRLDKNIALDADPSIIYAELLAGTYQGALHHDDMRFNSPYNTYRNAGLPPGPIANPGRSALEAAMHPAQTDYYYFVADAQGHHRFARTIEEHNKNVAAYRKAMRGRYLAEKLTTLESQSRRTEGQHGATWKSGASAPRQAHIRAIAPVELS